MPVHGDRDAHNVSFLTALTKSCTRIVESSVSEQVEALGVAGLLWLWGTDKLWSSHKARKIVVRMKHTRGLPSSSVFTHCHWGRKRWEAGRKWRWWLHHKISWAQFFSSLREGTSKRWLPPLSVHGKMWDQVCKRGCVMWKDVHRTDQAVFEQKIRRVWKEPLCVSIWQKPWGQRLSSLDQTSHSAIHKHRYIF